MLLMDCQPKYMSSVVLQEPAISQAHVPGNAHRQIFQEISFLLVFFTQGSYALVDVIKNFVCRERPSIHLGYSFPSGHTTTSMCFYGIIIDHYGSNNRQY